ncbi:MAG: zinc ABC transporter solute-binding protein [Gammaproteobacteria bacterium]|nr:zinc ABC transporter solute-binding protein [Gammaproteobacteria bacterium]
MSKTSWLFFILLYLFLPMSLAQADTPLTIYTVNYPLAYFAERIADDQARVVFPAPAGIDPAFWQPDIETIRAYQQADLILLNGAGYARWTSKVSLPLLRSVDTSRAFSDQLINSASGMSHSHGGGDAHGHAGTAFTTWLDFSQAAKQAVAIATALKRAHPLQADLFETNLRELEAELLELDRQLIDLTDKQPSLRLLASHPVYQYLARRYQLDLQSVTWEPDVIPDPSQWQTLENLHKDHAASWMIWEAEPEVETVKGLKDLGISTLIYQPMGNKPASGDFISVMSSNLKNLAKASGRE